MTEDTRKTYVPPEIESERAFTVLAASCGLNDPLSDINCDPDSGFGALASL